MTDVRQTVRSLARSPVFATAAVLSFALGIGANVALLSVIDRLVFRPLPFPEAGRLVVVSTATATADRMLFHAHAVAIQEQARTIDGFGIAYGAGQGEIVGEMGDAPVFIGSASSNLLQMFGIRPAAGRDFTPPERRDDEAPRELLITDAFWASRFNRSAEAVGRVFGTNQRRFRIIGVLPADYVHPTPELAGRIDGVAVLDPGVEPPARDRTILDPWIARLAPGATLADARAEAAVLSDRTAAEHPDFMSLDVPIRVDPLRSGMLLPYARFLWLILGAAGLVLLIACANLSTLLLARGRARVHETAIRTTLGASRWRLIISGGVEALAVCLAGSVVTILALAVAHTAIVAVIPPELRGFEVSAFDPRLLGLTIGLAAISAGLAAVAPAVASTRLDPMAGLSRRQQARGGGRLTPGRYLLAAEAAIAVVLVAGAAGAVRNFAGLILKDPGFRPPDLYRASVFFDPGRNLQNMERVRALETVAQVMSGVAGVDAWTAVTYPPVARDRLPHPYWSLQSVQGGVVGITDTTLDVLGTPVVVGRSISADDVRSAAPVAVVNLRAAASLWPGEPPEAVIGRPLTMPYGGVRDVVGVVADIRMRPGVSAWPMLYVPLGDGVAAKPGWAMELPIMLRMRAGERPDQRELQARFQALIPTGVVTTPVAVTEELAPWLNQPRFQAVLFGALGVIALALAAVGLYAVAAFDAARRQHETGVRLALGATRWSIRRTLVGGAVRPVVAGALAGLVVAWWAARYLQAYLFEVDARDPWTLMLVTGVLVATAAMAAWLPARRAARTDPASVLRAM